MTDVISLDRLDLLRRIDRSDMLSMAAALGIQCQDGLRIGRAWKVPISFRAKKKLLVIGMGGSAIGGDLVKDLLKERSDRPICVCRAYTIPSWVDRQTLALASSYSGNTEETLEAASRALKAGASLAAIASGGKLSDWAKRNGFPLLAIPKGMPPRAALGYMAFGPLGLLIRLGWVKGSFPAAQAAAGLNRFIEQRLLPTVPAGRNPAKKIARQLVGRLPILYGASGGWEAVTYRWRTQLEENAKTLAFHHLFPEATHNELSGWVEPRRLIPQAAAIFLVDPAIHPRVLRRMEFTKKVIRSQGAKALQVVVPGATRLDRILRMVALGDFVSIYLSILYGVDPTPVERVEALKRWLK